MKIRVTFFLLFLLGCHVASAQACGVYRIKYEAAFSSDEMKVINVALPSTWYLHGFAEWKSDFGCITISINDTRLEAVIMSHLTSANPSPDQIIALYKENRQSIPILITATDANNIQHTFQKEVSMSSVRFKKVSPDEGILFSLDLGELTF